MKNNIQIGKKYTVVPKHMGYFNMRHKIPKEHRNFIVTIIDTAENILGNGWYDKLTPLVAALKVRLQTSNTRSYVDFIFREIKKGKQQCYIVSLGNNKNESMYEIILESEIKIIKRNHE